MKNEKQIDKSMTMTKMKRSSSDPNGTMKLKQIKAWNLRLFMKSWLFLEHWQCSFWYTGCTGRRQMGHGEKRFGSDRFYFYKIHLGRCEKKHSDFQNITQIVAKTIRAPKKRPKLCKNHPGFKWNIWPQEPRKHPKKLLEFHKNHSGRC